MLFAQVPKVGPYRWSKISIFSIKSSPTDGANIIMRGLYTCVQVHRKIHILESPRRHLRVYLGPKSGTFRRLHAFARSRVAFRSVNSILL